MADRFEMDSERLRQVGASLGQLSDDLSRAVNNLTAACDQHGPCYGDDKTVGKPVGEKYEKPAQEARDNAAALAKQLSALAGGMNRTLATLGNTDEQNANAVMKTPRLRESG